MTTSDQSGVPDTAVRAARDIRVVFARLRRRLRDLPGGDVLSPTQAGALARLERLGSASASELAAAERVRPQSMAATVTALLDLGLVSRAPDPRDGRRQVITVTDAGREHLRGDRSARLEWLARALHERFTEDQHRVIIEAAALLDEVAQS